MFQSSDVQSVRVVDWVPVTQLHCGPPLPNGRAGGEGEKGEW